VRFDRYAFDLSQFSMGPRATTYSIRERYIWQLLFPDPKDQIYIEQPDNTAPNCTTAAGAALPARLRGDRLCFSRRAAHQPAEPHHVDAGRHRGVALLRLVGFASVVLGPPCVAAVGAIYRVRARLRLGLHVIRSGLIVEPPAFIGNAIGALTERLSRRFATS